MAKKYFHVRVQPKARRAEIKELGPGEYKVLVKSAPVRGEANREVVDLMASHFGIPSSHVRIIRGEKSRFKVIELIE
ncbi:MAG: DUF167 domain-containing protein [Candidatus Aminicenantales bacterium]